MISLSCRPRAGGPVVGLQACDRAGGARARRGSWRRFVRRASLHGCGRCRGRSSCSRGSRRAISAARSPPRDLRRAISAATRKLFESSARAVDRNTRPRLDNAASGARPRCAVDRVPARRSSTLQRALPSPDLPRRAAGRAPGHDGYPLRRNIGRESPEPWRSPARRGRRSRPRGSDSTLLPWCAGADTDLRRVANVSGLPAASARTLRSCRGSC